MNTGLLPRPLALGEGGHVCVLYRDETERDEALADFVGIGLAAGRRCLCVVPDPDTDPVLGISARTALGPDAQRLCIMGYAESYLRSPRFDPGPTLQLWDDTVRTLRADGGKISAVGDMAWVDQARPPLHSLLEYEHQLNEFARRHPQTVLCLYDARRLTGDELYEVARRHTAVVTGRKVATPNELPLALLAGTRGAQVAQLAVRVLRQAGCAAACVVTSDGVVEIAEDGEQSLTGDELRRMRRAASDGRPSTVVSWRPALRWERRRRRPLGQDRWVLIVAGGRSALPPDIDRLFEELCDQVQAGLSHSDAAASNVDVEDLPRLDVADPIGSIASWVAERTGAECVVETPDGVVLARASGGVRQRAESSAAATYPLRSSRELLGVLKIQGADDVSLAPRDLAHAAALLCVELQHVVRLRESEFQQSWEWASEIVHGRRILGGCAGGWGIDLGQPYHVVVVRAEARPGVVSVIQQLGRRRGVAVLATMKDGDVVLVTDGDRPRLEALLEEAAELVGMRAAGVSAAALGEAAGDRAYREARRSADLAASTGAGVQFFDDLGVLRMLLTGSDFEPVEAFVEEWLAPILDYDAEHGSDLVTTLVEFLLAGGRQAAAAEALGIHVSTLKYRMRRIAELTGYSLSDPETRFHLEVATRAWRVLRALGERSASRVRV